MALLFSFDHGSGWSGLRPGERRGNVRAGSGLCVASAPLPRPWLTAAEHEVVAESWSAWPSSAVVEAVVTAARGRTEGTKPRGCSRD